MANTILCLWDFTPQSLIGLESAINYADTLGRNSSIILFHVCPEAKVTEAKAKLDQLVTESHHAIIIYEVASGDLYEEFEKKCKILQPICVSFGTHGIRGIKQNLFGAHSVKLLKACDCPVLIASQESFHHDVNKSILLDYNRGFYGSTKHKEFLFSTAVQFSDNFLLYYVNRMNTDIDSTVIIDMNVMEERLIMLKKNMSKIVENKKDTSFGFAKQTCEYANFNSSSLIVTRFKDDETEHSKLIADAEYLINNPYGIPVLFV